MLGRPDPSVAAKLAKICGLLSSDQAGERSAAAWQATRLLQAHDLSWAQLVERAFQAPPPAVQPPVQAQHIRDVQWALRFPDRLNAWEQQFLADLAQRRRITAKQAAVLDGIVRKLGGGA